MARQHRGRGAAIRATIMPSPRSLYPCVLALVQSPPSPGPATSHTNIQVADMEGLLLRQLAEDTAAGRAQGT